eukprot:766900-Hanusia_phi.AAC.2
MAQHCKYAAMRLRKTRMSANLVLHRTTSSKCPCRLTPCRTHAQEEQQLRSRSAKIFATSLRRSSARRDGLEQHESRRASSEED